MFSVEVHLRLFITTILWVCSAANPIPPCQKYSIDQIISNAMTSPSGYDFMYDERHGIIRVDMDMIFSIDEWNRFTNKSCTRHNRIHKRQAIKNGVSGSYWTGGIVYYDIIKYDFNYGEVKMIHSAMNEWMKHTCVQFRPAGLTAQNRIRFANANGCSSHVGMVGGVQHVNLARGCRQKGVVVHELGHALGFQHEQTRPDRDNYIKIHYENVPNYLRYNFRKYPWDVIADLGVPYDYLSIMHYGRDSFSHNRKDTIETLDYRYQKVIGRRQTLSFRDIKSTNIMYNCRAAIQDCHLRDEDCPGEGFVGKNCMCWCPPKNPVSRKPYDLCRSDSRPGSLNNVGPSPGYTGPPGGNTALRTGNGNGYRGDCVDMNDNCHLWASQGDCTEQLASMQYYCRKSCGLCNTVPPTCRDESTSCGYWRHQGYCRRSSSFNVFMTTTCRSSCGFCRTDPGPDEHKIRPCERNCRDEHPLCVTWAARGECSATEDYMRLRCRKACNLCCSEDTGDNRTSEEASYWLQHY